MFRWPGKARTEGRLPICLISFLSHGNPELSAVHVLSHAPSLELARILHEVHEQSGLLDDLHRSTFASFCEEISENSASALKFSSLEDMSGRCLSDQVEIELHRRRQLGIIKEDSAIVHWKCLVHGLRLDR